MRDSRYIVGIDLGTTNIAVAFIDTESGDKIEMLPLPQLTSPGELSESELMPAFYYLPDPKQIPKGALNLPWNKKNSHTVGIYARNHGVDNPDRFIASAKSWLCHAGIDRRQDILPWNSESQVCAKSPVEVTRLYLDHIIKAWDYKFKRKKDCHGNPCNLQDQQVAITVPASFDETARDLTLEAAKQAGFRDISLLEEPLAVFYAWLDRQGENWSEQIKPGEKVLVLDMGGGTCDFSIIAVDNDGKLLREAAGDHLLLGGDNIDISIARQIEQSWSSNLKPGEWSTLCQKTREAKEKILNSKLKEVELVLFSKGSSVIGGMRKSLVKRKQLLDTLKNGFFPEISSDSTPPRKSSGMRNMGLPYVADPAATRHLLDFLRYAAKIANPEDENPPPLRPDHILFNGGSMIPGLVRKRLMDIIGGWFPEENVNEIESRDLSLAVAHGAAYYARVRRGKGVKVRGGTTRSYFIEVDQSDREKTLICVMPRGVDENQIITSPRKFLLEANQKVAFPLLSSSTRLNDKPGDIAESDDELTLLSNLVSVLKFGKSEEKAIEAKIGAELTETGVLKVWIEALKTKHKWPLNFDVRLIADESMEKDNSIQITVDSSKVDDAKNLISEMFDKNAKNLASLFKILEKTLEIPRNEWPLPLLRELADTFLKIPYASLKTVEKESRWLNLCGFCLRPGFGDPADELRLKKAWKIWYAGLQNRNQAQSVSEWWIFWRRLASGMRSGHQRTIFQDLLKTLCPKGEYSKKAKFGLHAKAEMWRCLGALEALSVEEKSSVVKILRARCEDLADFEFWVLARTLTRRLFHAPATHILPANLAGKCLDSILSRPPRKEAEMARTFAISRLAAKCGDRKLDLDPDRIAAAKNFLKQNQAPEQWLKHLDGIQEESNEERSKIFGDSLPLGLKLMD